jgi:putative endonuclease
MQFSLYIVECADGTYYTGIATDVARRLGEHNGGALTGARGTAARGRGARYTATRRPVALVFTEAFPNRSAALKEEARIKRLSRVEKEKLIDGRASR